MTLVLVAILGTALVAPWIQRAAPRWSGWLLALVPASSCAWLLGAAPASERTAWAPSVGLELALRADGLARLFALLILGIGALVLVYTGAYLAGHPRQGRMFTYLLVFMASMFGIVVSDNLLALFLFWELTSISSFLLIGFEQERQEARAAALQALLVTAGGGLALLPGVLLLAHAGGTFTISELVAVRDVVIAHPLYPAALLLILAGAFTKSAQVPFHFWLPNAMEAPTPVSAYLHSSTMVKAGVFLLARLHPAVGGTELWIAVVATIGGATAVTGAVLAYRQTDLKRALAYSTVSALGLMTMLLGIGSHAAIRGALLLLFAHAMYKGALFLAAGVIAHETHERDVTRLGGLARALPFTALAAGMAALSMAGVPPLGGFLSKELMLEAVLADEGFRAAAGAATVVTSMLLAAVAVTVAFRPFFGERPAHLAHAHEGRPALWLGPVILALGGIAAGLAPEHVAAPWVDPAARSIGVDAELAALHLWHGVTPALVLGVLSLAGGALLAWRWRPPTASWAVRGPEAAYAAALRALAAGASQQTRLLQSGYLRHYMFITISVTVVIVGSVMLLVSTQPSLAFEAIAFHEGALLVIILLSTAATLRSSSRLAAVATLGIVGYAVALVYISFGAPDLAMTQFVVETLTVILFLLALRRVPATQFRATERGRLRDAVIATGAGVLMCALVLLSTRAIHPNPISGYFVERSLPDAHGRNVVNVILVDFRALDTLGEITVLALAGTGVYALVRLRPQHEEGRR